MKAKTTEKDVELVQAIANGSTITQIANEWGLSSRTVESRVKKIKAVWVCKHLPALVATFYRNGLIT